MAILLPSLTQVRADAFSPGGQSRIISFDLAASEMAARVRDHHWAASPLGPTSAWPQSLRTAVEIMVGSGHAIQLAWGPEQIVLYNDAYAPMLGERHPSALGLPFRKAWPDVWSKIEPLVNQVLAGETVTFQDRPLEMTRYGHPEGTWWTFSYSIFTLVHGEAAQGRQRRSSWLTRLIAGRFAGWSRA